MPPKSNGGRWDSSSNHNQQDRNAQMSDQEDYDETQSQTGNTYRQNQSYGNNRNYDSRTYGANSGYGANLGYGGGEYGGYGGGGYGGMHTPFGMPGMGPLFPFFPGPLGFPWASAPFEQQANSANPQVSQSSQGTGSNIQAAGPPQQPQQQTGSGRSSGTPSGADTKLKRYHGCPRCHNISHTPKRCHNVDNQGYIPMCWECGIGHFSDQCPRLTKLPPAQYSKKMCYIYIKDRGGLPPLRHSPGFNLQEHVTRANWQIDANVPVTPDEALRRWGQGLHRQVDYRQWNKVSQRPEKAEKARMTRSINERLTREGPRPRAPPLIQAVSERSEPPVYASTQLQSSAPQQAPQAPQPNWLADFLHSSQLVGQGLANQRLAAGGGINFYIGPTTVHVAPVAPLSLPPIRPFSPSGPENPTRGKRENFSHGLKDITQASSGKDELVLNFVNQTQPGTQPQDTTMAGYETQLASRASQPVLPISEVHAGQISQSWKPVLAIREAPGPQSGRRHSLMEVKVEVENGDAEESAFNVKH